MMRGRGVIAAAVGAVCGAVALAVPARADQYDFLMQLDNMGVYYDSVTDMIDIGKGICHELRFGVPPPAVLGKLDRTGFAPAESAIVLVSAVDTLCLDAKPTVLEWARSIGPTQPL
ncbi:hypothetical protein BHQ17_04855 [Mycolicibacterium holsaticum]|uniref:DUF732 domain-containing protein n=1 Tax=Mycolicibacterium holsaticum TaxID=152142 RepID=A0A1E3S025_9MYCO|nr:hypothetical protein BHQ17_04855 [Mycolicibacterium holsaticum]